MPSRRFAELVRALAIARALRGVHRLFCLAKYGILGPSAYKRHEGIIRHDVPWNSGSQARIVLAEIAPSSGNETVVVKIQVLLPSRLRCDCVEVRFADQTTTLDVTRRDCWQIIALSTSGTPRLERIELVVDGLRSRYRSLFSAGLGISAETRLVEYEVVSCERLASLIDGVEVVTIEDATSILLAPVMFGTREKPDFSILEYPPGGWDNGARIVWGPLKKYCIRDAVVHGEEGWVTVGPYLIEESIRLASFREGELSWTFIGSGKIRMRSHEPTMTIDVGSNLFSGYPGSRNYAHWMIDVLPAAASPLIDEDTILLWADVETPFRRETLDFVGLHNRSIFMGSGMSISCRRLRINPFSHVDAGHYPHPIRMVFVRALLARALPDPEARRLIYIARRDSNARKLIDEEAVIKVVTVRGFEILTLSGMSVLDQVRLFAEAAIVVGPHGAGLTNIMFCQPGTLFLELLPDNYVQWSMRRLASLVPVRYGCVIGRSNSDAPNQQALNWRVDVNVVSETIDQMLALFQTSGAPEVATS